MPGPALPGFMGSMAGLVLHKKSAVFGLPPGIDNHRLALAH
jgi:hypothetical protein